MKLFLAIGYLVLLILYIASHLVVTPYSVTAFREYAERLILYFYLVSLALLSLSEIASRFFAKKKKTASELQSDHLKAYVYTTRIIGFLVLVGFPLFLYFNWSRSWNLSDAVVVSIPTILLAIVIAEQNIYTYSTSRLERFGIEQARVMAIFQIVDTIMKSPNRKGIPEDYDLDELDERLRLWEDRTADANFARFAAQARNTLRAIRKNQAEGVWEQYLNRLYTDLRGYVATFT